MKYLKEIYELSQGNLWNISMKSVKYLKETCDINQGYLKYNSKKPMK